MGENAKIQEAILKAVDQMNEQLPAENRLGKERETVLFGKSGQLDSLGLVNLIVTTEEIIKDEFGVSVTLADEKAISQKNSPFRTIGSLSDYVSALLENG